MDRRHPLALVLAVAFLLAVDPALAASGQDRSQAIYPPQRLPIAFSHTRHLAAGAGCTACHDAARKSTRASDRLLPGHPECEDCHDLQGAAQGRKVDPPASCQTCHPGFDQTVRRSPERIDLPTANLRFNHEVHVEKKVDCKVCHGDLEQVELATRMQLPKMATCLTCHDGSAAPAECTTCHLKQPSGRLQLEFTSGLLRPMQGDPLGLDHGPRYEFNHGTRATLARQTCTRCHTESYCQTCHDSMQKPLSVHPNDFITLHPVQARAEATRCQACHRMQSFCVACHERAGVSMEADRSLRARNVRVHPDYNTWVVVKGPQHHGIQASRDITPCISCHREETCISCHADPDKGGQRGYSVDPHPGGFAARCAALAAKNDRPCLKCHSSSQLHLLGCL